MSPRQTGAQTDVYRNAGVGLQFAATIGLFALLGYWVDGLLGSGPWLLIVGVFLGFGVGLAWLVAKLGPRRDASSPSNRDPR